MFFLFSGEGPTDLGGCAEGARDCTGAAYEYGPLTVVVSQIVEERHGYRLLETGHFGYVSKNLLRDRAAELKSARKGLLLPGKKRSKETRYFFNNARVLARIAAEMAAELNDDVVAVLFRDKDGTASAGRGLWAEKWQSMLDGFSNEGFSKWVPMLPNPKSEAWILCALKFDYQDCDSLEQRSGNDNSPNSLKAELAEFLGEDASRTTLCAKAKAGEIDSRKISLPSFREFKSRLEEVI